MLTKLDEKHTVGTYLMFKDEGPLSVGAVTRKYSVTSRLDGGLVGYVKWFNHWRKYCFFSLNSILEEICMTDLSEFIVETTKAHKDKRSKT